MLFFQFLEKNFISGLIPFDGTIDEAITVLYFTMPKGRAGQIWKFNNVLAEETQNQELLASQADMVFELIAD